MSKIQIRRGVFETNSSSVHALVMPKQGSGSVKELFAMAEPSVQDYCRDNVVVLDVGVSYPDCVPFVEGRDAVEAFKNRVDVLVDSLMDENTRKMVFFIVMKMLFEVFDELGIRYEIRNNDMKFDCYHEANVNVLEGGIITTKEDIAGFLFHPMSCAFDADRDEFFCDMNEGGPYKNLNEKSEESGCVMWNLGSDY